ncbi:FG-GAP-like repeat-containing protein [Hoeflea sp. BAL378]|uniref:FG-GAP-like repeat-containing protein n=1 Tax=Hoeflea sp. BAL378 TaxID=1547437 RepID=UPI00068EE75F|nr:FG-GAP-like repeat-containing protein [Hoeflea sp. BAL378]
MSSTVWGYLGGNIAEEKQDVDGLRTPEGTISRLDDADLPRRPAEKAPDQTALDEREGAGSVAASRSSPVPEGETDAAPYPQSAEIASRAAGLNDSLWISSSTALSPAIAPTPWDGDLIASLLGPQFGSGVRYIDVMAGSTLSGSYYDDVVSNASLAGSYDAGVAFGAVGACGCAGCAQYQSQFGAGFDENGTSSTTVAVAATGNQLIDGLLSGVRWSGSISYSDPDSAADYQGGYNSNANGNGLSAQNEGFSQFSAQQMSALHFALNQAIYTQTSGVFAIEAFTNIDITYAGAGTGASTMRYANSSDAATAYAYYPNNNIYGGDSFFGVNARTPTAGNYSWMTTLHEIGHSMGLAHGHTGGGYGALPANYDSHEYSLMTYRSYIGSNAQFVYNETFGYPQTYMMLDILALQHMYGADYSVNSGNTTYSWSPTTGETYINGVLNIDPGGNRIFATIWDGGGTDTYDLSNYSSNLIIDLNPGGHSVFSSAQLAYLGGGPNGGYARGNIFNAMLFGGNTASLIENAIGGSGSDTFTGNVGNNVLSGNGGFDTVIFSGNRSSYLFTETNSYSVTGNSQGTDTLNSIERFQFADITVVDDVIGGTNTTQAIAVNASRTGEIQFRGDLDWYQATLTGGQNYVLDLRGSPTGNGTLSDPFVRMYNAAGTEIALNDDAGIGFEAQLTVRVTDSGTYFFGARRFGDSGTGTYLMELEGLSGNTRFQNPTLELNSFGPNAGGWSSNNIYLRTVADVNGDGLSDIVGFGGSNVYVSLGSNGGFIDPVASIASFGQGYAGGGWSNNDYYTRTMGDVNGDGRADIVGFGSAGVYISLSTGSTSFADPYLDLTSFGPASGGWTSNNYLPRTLGDINGDGRDDIVGFGSAGVYVALARTSGTPGFNDPIFALNSLGSSDAGGGWSSFEQFPRTVADVNGDGRDDLIGFGGAGVYTAMGQADGTFAPVQFALDSFGFSPAGGSWASFDAYPRLVRDLNLDGRADIVGFGGSFVYTAMGQADGTFGNVVQDLASFGASPSAGSWSSNDLYPRLLGDVTGDFRPDILAFGSDGVYVSRDFDFVTV